MKNKEYFKDKIITVIGFARSGLTCANLLSGLGARVSITDNNDNQVSRANLVKLKSRDILVELGSHTREFIAGRDLIVVSPGVPDTALPLVWAKELNIPVVSEIEVAAVLCPATIIAATGSNGKTTVTTLIGTILQANKQKSFICGNIGNPFTGELDKITADDFVSLEVSSFQLEKIRSFKPKIALILNFSRNHLDRYANMQEYLEAKKRIFMNQDGFDYLVLNESDPVLRDLAKETSAKVVFFSQSLSFNPNQSAVLAVASILGISKDVVMGVFGEFKGIEHRMEYVAQINDIKFINDSKATTVESAAWALNNISAPIILIAGGKDKGSEYQSILSLAEKKVKAAVLIGAAKEKIKKSWAGSLLISDASSLEEAVSLAFRKANPGDCVLLSPMCSSFDMFTDYEHRGRVFKDAVYALMANEKNLATKQRET